MTGPANGVFDSGYDLPEPSDAELERLAHELGYEMSEETFAVIAANVRASVAGLRGLTALEPASPETRHPRVAGRLPRPEENPHNAWSWRCNIQGADAGPLAGVTVAVKESVCVSGVPMSNGSALLEGHVPAYDATVVTRVLDAGATVVGKATSENLGLSSSSNTSVTGAVTNPAKAGHTVGGSSSGCAALVASSACDLAIGTDQGGSIRNPASLCGVYGLKPTFGTVPYTGVLSIETSLDHVGFLARELDLLRTALEVTGGPDGMDPRQGWYPGDDAEGATPVRFGVLREGVDAVGDDPECVQHVERIISDLTASGSPATPVSFPEHTSSALVATPIYAEGIWSQLSASGGTSLGWKGFYPESELIATLASLRSSPGLMPDTGKLFSLLGAHLRRTHLGRYYARAQNIGVALRRRYDELIARHGVLLMPACAPFPVAQPLPEAPGPAEVFEASFGYHLNTAIFNITGHPAISLPAGEVRGLPFGLMLVGARHDEAGLLRAAQHADAVLRAAFGPVTPTPPTSPTSDETGVLT